MVLLVEPKCCEPGGRALFLPLLDAEQHWPRGVRAVLYITGLFWCFMGVAIVADVFMGAIETITSKKVRKQDEHGRMRTHAVWNATVANLMLMALGSSAPEILLSVIEIFTNNFFSGDLGPSTVVGSAAFNLLCISAVCVHCIPNGEVRYIKEVPVYAITASFSIFAYVWLIFILDVSSPNVVEIWEGLTTFLAFPVLVILAFLADKGYFSPAGEAQTESAAEKSRGTAVAGDMSFEELAHLEMQVRQKYGDQLTEEQLIKMIEEESQAPPSRAAYRVGATRKMVGGKRVASKCSGHDEDDPLYNVVPTVGAGADKSHASHKAVVPTFNFVATEYTVLENAGTIRLPVIRSGDLSCAASCWYCTRPGLAKAGSDYIHIDGQLSFAANEDRQDITVVIIDDTAFEQDEDFFVDLSVDKSKVPAEVGPHEKCRIVIRDDDEPGELCFKGPGDAPRDEVIVVETQEDQVIEIIVDRKCGGTGVVGCEFRTEDDSALAGPDYEGHHGKLEFENGQTNASIWLTIKAVGRYERREMFRLIIDNSYGGATFCAASDGGKESCILSIFIESDPKSKEHVEKLMETLKVNWDKARVGHGNWKDQFMDAIMVNGGDDEGSQPGPLDYFMHVLTVFWKVIFACIPPTDFCGGWLCFVCALIAIGLTTAIIGDMANLVGCVIDIPNEITAITFVALGTSLPDTFASKTAAQQDAHADASIGNVTGSNSVNVFLGLGMPWAIAAMYWTGNGADAEWNRLYADKAWAKDWLDGAFVVEAGSLVFSVSIFSTCAIIAICLLFVRRKLVGGELGGDLAIKNVSSAFLVGLWFLYVGLSINNITN
jgi:solute carrier family 8 (sodium/calcium exchanger)